MKDIAIIGCGGAAMILGHTLLRHGDCRVTVFSEKTAQEWFDGPPTGTPFVAGENIDIERELDIEYWEDEMYFGDGVMLDFRMTRGTDPLTVRGRFGKLGAAVDLRSRVSRWMREFEARGGNLVIERVTRERAEAISADANLTILATGKGELGSIVPRDDERSEFDRPQRCMFASLVTGVKGWGLRNDRLTRPVKFTFFADAGEWFTVPFTHVKVGPCYGLNFMVRRGSYLDRFRDARDCDAFVEIAKSVVAEIAPEDADALGDMRPVDAPYNYLPFADGILPFVRQSHAVMPSGGMVVPVGDAAITYDPIGGQGYNSAARHARALADAIIEHRNGNFDADWARETFGAFWEDHARWSCAWNNLMLKGVPPATAMALEFAAGNSAFANMLFADYFSPKAFMPWITDEAKVKQRIAAATEWQSRVVN